MSPLASPDALANILRLKGLKNATGRKVMPGAEFLQKLQGADMEVEDTSQSPPEVSNLPESDLGGELTPQSYDVRANSPPPPEPQEEETGFFSKLGRALGDYVNPQKREEMSQYQKSLNLRAQNPSSVIPEENSEIPQQLPQEEIPEMPQQPTEQGGMWGNIKSIYEGIKDEAQKDYFAPMGTESWLYGEGPSENKTLLENAQMKAQGKDPEMERARIAEQENSNEANLAAEIEQAQQNPGEHIVYGATDLAAQQPDLQEKYRQITGMDLEPHIQEEAKKYEKVLSDMGSNNEQEMAGYDEQLERIRQRIETNSATDMDKYYIGVALLMPLLIGAMFGKEAAIGALGGAAKGFTEMYGRREKNIREDEDLLSNVNKLRSSNELKKGEIELEKLKIPAEIRKNAPKDEKEYLKGMNEVSWTDPDSGEQMNGVEIKPNLIALPQYVANKKQLDSMGKEANEINDALVPTQDINKLTNDIIFLSSKLKDKNILGQALSSFLVGKNPGLSSKLGEEVEFEGRKVNSMIALEHKLKLLTDAYRQAKGMRALTSTVQEHIDGLFRNPSASLQSYQDTIDQMLYTRDLAQNRLANTAKSHGFAPQFLFNDFGKENRKVYDTLNKKEGEKESDMLLGV